MKIYLFKVKHYSTILIGQTIKKQDTFGQYKDYFYVQRADGTEYSYAKDFVEWYKLIYDENDQEIKLQINLKTIEE